MRLSNRRASDVAWAVVFFAVLIMCVVALLCGCDGNAVMYYDSSVNKLDVGQRFVTDDEDSRFSTVVDTQTGTWSLRHSKGHQNEPHPSSHTPHVAY